MRESLQSPGFAEGEPGMLIFIGQGQCHWWWTSSRYHACTASCMTWFSLPYMNSLQCAMNFWLTEHIFCHILSQKYMRLKKEKVVLNRSENRIYFGDKWKTGKLRAMSQICIKETADVYLNINFKKMNAWGTGEFWVNNSSQTEAESHQVNSVRTVNAFPTVGRHHYH